jgi:putative endonuclease
MAYSYIVECADGSYYAGWTTDLDARLASHNAGAGSRYTRSRLPVRLVYWEAYADQNQARRRECEIKQLSRRQKELLVASWRQNTEAASQITGDNDNG